MFGLFNVSSKTTDSRTFVSNNTTNNTTNNTANTTFNNYSSTNRVNGIGNSNFVFSNTAINAPITISISRSLQGEINLLEYEIMKKKKERFQKATRRKKLFSVIKISEHTQIFKGLTAQIEEMVFKLAMLRIERYGIDEVQKQQRLKLQNILSTRVQQNIKKKFAPGTLKTLKACQDKVKCSLDICELAQIEKDLQLSAFQQYLQEHKYLVNHALRRDYVSSRYK